jgi:hypothetical protein
VELKSIKFEKSVNPKRVRLCGEVAYNDKAFGTDIFWFDVPERLAEFLSTSGNPWLACLIPLAVTLDEPLCLCEPIDPRLLENAKNLMKIWNEWYPDLSIVKIDADLQDINDEMSGDKKTVAFFSGGIDSFFTVLHNDSTSELAIDELLLILGMDIKIENYPAFKKLYDSLQKAAQSLNRELIYLATNLRETRLSEAKWGGLSHGAILASFALALEKRYKKALISSTHASHDLQPWGSTPITDPLLSTGGTEIVHYGSDFTRVQKTEVVAKSDVALKTLKVCANSRSDENCSSCSKCYRTMINFDLLGVLDRCPRLSRDRFDIKKISKVYLRDENARSFYEELKSLAISKGRPDIAEAIEKSFRHSTRLAKWISVADYLRKKPYVWRWSKMVESLFLSRSID